jgi:hypothetical protein
VPCWLCQEGQGEGSRPLMNGYSSLLSSYSHCSGEIMRSANSAFFFYQRRQLGRYSVWIWVYEAVISQDSDWGVQQEVSHLACGCTEPLCHFPGCWVFIFNANLVRVFGVATLGECEKAHMMERLPTVGVTSKLLP